MRSILLTMLLAAGLPARAGQLHYVAYAAGLRVLDIDVNLDISPVDYKVGLRLRTVGMFGAMVSGETTTEVSGTWSGTAASPRRYDSHGLWRGEVWRTVIDYLPGGPLVRDVQPPPDPAEREPVSADLQLGTVDTLSGMAALVRQIAHGQGCAARVRLFDGRRLSEVESRAAGEDVLAATERSAFQGPALRCDIRGRLLAGFARDEDRVRAARPKEGSVWLASLDSGGPRVPVRVTFETRFFGHATMYLTGGG